MPRSVLVGHRIRERRMILGVKQSELARKAGISASYLNLIEHNRRRIGGKLVVDIAHHLSVDPRDLTEGAEALLLEAMGQAAAEHPLAKPEIDRSEDFAARFPGWAKLVAAQHQRQGVLERTVAVLSDRLTHDPFLAASLHEVISTVTAIRSTSSILAENTDIDPEWLARFHRNINEESRRLTESSQSLVAYLDGVGETDTGGLSPQEELDRFLTSHGHHLPDLEAGDEAAPERILTDTPIAMSKAGRLLIRHYLERYVRDAVALPMSELVLAFQTAGPDPLQLATVLNCPLPLVLRRLATLPNDVVDMHMGIAICDGSGAVLFRREMPGFPMPRLGTGCPLWPLYQALSRPMTPIRQVIEQSNRLQDQFVAYAFADVMHPAGFAGPQTVEATMLVLSMSEDRQETGLVQSVGVSCRICPRSNCIARREPSVLAEEF